MVVMVVTVVSFAGGKGRGAVTSYAFMSDEWMAEARRIREEYADQAPTAPVAVRMNQVITKVPFGEGRIDAHLDTTGGTLDLELGHLEAPDVTVTVDYDTARSLFVGADPAAAMQAFMSGRIKVDGDITKLLTLAGGLPGAGIPGAPPVAPGAAPSGGDSPMAGAGGIALDVARRLQAITA